MSTRQPAVRRVRKTYYQGSWARFNTEKYRTFVEVKLEGKDKLLELMKRWKVVYQFGDGLEDDNHFWIEFTLRYSEEDIEEWQSKKVKELGDLLVRYTVDKLPLDSDRD